jgi:hypothetical protein
MINKDYLNRVLSNDELHSKIIGNSWTVFKFSTEPISIPTNYFFWLEQDESNLLFLKFIMSKYQITYKSLASDNDAY